MVGIVDEQHLAEPVLACRYRPGDRDVPGMQARLHRARHHDGGFPAHDRGQVPHSRSPPAIISTARARVAATSRNQPVRRLGERREGRVRCLAAATTGAGSVLGHDTAVSLPRSGIDMVGVVSCRSGVLRFPDEVDPRAVALHRVDGGPGRV
jgi:hypothetical protein